MIPTWVPYGQMSFVQIAPNRFRTARNGVPGAYPVYARWHSTQKFEAPFCWSGKFLIHKKLVDPILEATGKPPTYDPALNFHPVHVDNSNNIVIGTFNTRKTAQSITVEKDHVYGGKFIYRICEPIPVYVLKTWYNFELSSPVAGRFILKVNGKILLDAIEENPTFRQAAPIGLRTDFIDMEFANMTVELISPSPTAVLWRHPKYNNVFLVGTGPAVNVTPKLFHYYRNVLMLPFMEEAHEGMLASCVSQSGAKLTPV